MHKNKKRSKRILRVALMLLVVVVAGLIFPTWTPEIRGKNSISELRKVEINGENIEVICKIGN